MADFPDNIFDQRALANVPGQTFDPSKTTRLYAEDVSMLGDEVTAIEETLGVNPEGAFDTVDERIQALEDSPPGATYWGDIGGTLADQTDLQTALNAKQNSLGFTAENQANKENTTIDTNTTKYPTVNLLKTGLDTKQNSLGFTAENVANKDTDGTLSANSDTKYPSQKATKTYVDTGLATKQASLGFTPENVANKQTSIGFDNDGYPSGQAVRDALLNGYVVDNLTSCLPKPIGSLGSGAGTARAFNSNVTASVGAIFVPYYINPQKISIRLGTVTTTGTLKIALYRYEGAEQLWEITTPSLSSASNANKVVTIDISGVTSILPPGLYYILIVPVGTASMQVYCWTNSGLPFTATEGLDTDVAGYAKFNGTLTVTAGTPPTSFDAVTDITEVISCIPITRFDV